MSAKSLALIGIGVTLALAGAELGARLDDWMYLGISPLANPTYSSELRLHDDGFVRGRPNGRYRRWKLNEHGFNGPANGLLPDRSCPRLIVLGASETFGSFESPGREFLSQLRERLAEPPCFEVINASIVGMSIGSALPYWSGWVQRFRPDFVLIYANPLLSLAIQDDSDDHCVRRPPGARPAAAEEPGGLRSRFVERLQDSIDQPQWLVSLRTRWRIARRLGERAADWPLAAVPTRCFESFEEDLRALVEAVRTAGARPIVSTHASTFASEASRPQNELFVRTWVLRVEAPGQFQYHEAANDLARSLADEDAAAVFDADRVLRGCTPCFVDPVHFSDAGAARLATSLASFLIRLPGWGEHAVQ